MKLYGIVTGWQFYRYTSMQTYRSGHNGADSKSVSRATGTRVRIPPSAVYEKVPEIVILFVKSMVSGTFLNIA